MSSPIYTQEKAPLLPLNSEEECQRLDCYKNKLYKRKYKNQTIMVVLFIIFYSFYNGYHESLLNSARGNKNVETSDTYNTINSAQDLSTLDTFSGLVFEDQVDALEYCREKPQIPYNGPSTFEFDSKDFPKLSVSENTKYYRGQSVSVVGGKANVYEDKSLSKVTVEFILKFNRDELQDLYYIEKIEHTESGLYELKLKNNDQRVSGCVTIDINVGVPTVAALDNFSLSVLNANVNLHKGLTFKELAISVANGHVEFGEGISTAKTGFALANGHVSGVIDTLSDELHLSMSNGRADVKIKEIDASVDIPIVFKASNGHIDLEVPTTFKSTFSLTAMNGRRIVESSVPEDIHSKTSRWGPTTGYYGNDAQVKNSITLTSYNGRLRLNYA
ncbi:hypothetical protein INT47_004591 [Mucor saturninus]|uniref:Adhesin domain-containing protein n=1 Tax=Mucor saturninus TaxID=64648 RepID=A0A8H7RI57_9FUNG|nr:hypothetical protein INT47_004591 [Mucor saturninus]